MRVLLTCLVIAVLAVIVPMAALAAPKLPFVVELETEITGLESELSDQRKDLLTAIKAEELIDGRATRLARQVEGGRKVLGALPFGGDPLLEIIASDSYAGRELGSAKAAHDRARQTLLRETDRAAQTQAELADAQRRLAALQTALSTTGTKSARPEEAILSYGWGGPDTAPVSADTLDDYLESKASPMAGSGEALLRSGHRWNIDPRFIVAIAGAESYFGLQLCASHNAWGWGCPTSPVGFRSWADGIDTVSQGLRENYLDSGRTTVDEVHSKYAPQGATNDPNGLNYAWANNVARFLQEQGGNPNDIEGPGRRDGVSAPD